MIAPVRSLNPAQPHQLAPSHESQGAVCCNGRARHFLGNSFVYLLLSHRAQGLSIGVSVNPDRYCNFHCAYCDVDRSRQTECQPLELPQLTAELRRTLALVQEGRVREVPAYRSLPDQLLALRHVAISGDGEPTLCPHFPEALESIVHLRALGQVPYFKLVVLTNGSGLHVPEVHESLRHLPLTDEVWVKLDAGTQAYMNKVNRTDVPLARVLENILGLARHRHIIIYSTFCSLNGETPSLEEIEHYADRLTELSKAGAQISLVQICSANHDGDVQVRHLPLKRLSAIARTVQRLTGLRAEVF